MGILDDLSPAEVSMALARLKIPILPVKAHIAGLSVVASLILLAGLIQPALSLGETPSEATGTPLAVHPENPHSYIFQGKPTVLITSAEHYGAVVNKDFDYVAYLDTLHSYGLNYTRIYPGFLFEPIG